MFKRSSKYYRRLLLLAGSILALLAYMHIQMPTAHAADGQITITPNVGHTGTNVTITGTNFAQDETLRLYTTANPDRCTGNGSPNSLGLKSFTTSPTVQVTGGAFTLTNIPWPDNANTVQTTYYIC